MKKSKLAIFSTHPIQYNSPFFKFLYDNLTECDVTVYYFSDFSLRPYFDVESKSQINWDNEHLIEGYKNIVLKNMGNDKNNGFFSYFNPSIFNEIKKNKYDLVLCYGWSSLSHWQVILSSIFTKTPFSFRGDSNILNESNIQGVKKAIKKSILSYLFNKASTVFYTGTQNKKFYQHYGATEDKLFSTPFAIDNQKFINIHDNLNKKEFKDDLNIPKNHTVITFAGRFVKRKNPHLLLEAVKSIENSNLTVLMIGSGEMEEELRVQASKMTCDVIFTGFLDQPEIPKYLSISDVFILPSSSEPWGLVINESMCCKTAILASDKVGAAIDLVEEGVNGYTFKIDDVNDLRKKIILLLNSDINRFKNNSLERINRWSYSEGVEGIRKYFEIQIKGIRK